MRDPFNETPKQDGDVIRKHSQSFSLAARLLPKRIRADVETLYAWCRWCDNAVDDAPTPDIARVRLATLRADVELIYEGKSPIHAASQWLADLFSRYSIPKDNPLELLDGMEMDLSQCRINSEKELHLYCHRAAGTVGLMMCHILGVNEPQARRFADALGIAMQLTNIARDVAEDWQRGRCYLPEPWLDRRLEPGNPPRNDDVRLAVKQLLDLADHYYTLGLKGLRYLPVQSRIAILASATIYREIGQIIREKDFRVMDGRVRVPKIRKLKLVAQSIILTCEMNFVSSAFFGMISTPNTQSIGEPMNKDARYLAVLGVSLTFILAAAMFILVGIKPKDSEAYSSLPWIYSFACALCGGVTQLILRRMESTNRT
jgi:15-cis-phytoene synthase